MAPQWHVESASLGRKISLDKTRKPARADAWGSPLKQPLTGATPLTPHKLSQASTEPMPQNVNPAILLAVAMLSSSPQSPCITVKWIKEQN